METSTVPDQNRTGGRKSLWSTIRKPCLTLNCDLQMQLYSDCDAAQPICDKSETVAVKWRIADMVMTAVAVSVVLSVLCGVKRLCACVK